jgi:hypothetical protein
MASDTTGTQPTDGMLPETAASSRLLGGIDTEAKLKTAREGGGGREGGGDDTVGWTSGLVQRRVPRETKESISLTLAAWIEGEGIEEALNDKRDLLSLGPGWGQVRESLASRKAVTEHGPFSHDSNAASCRQLTRTSFPLPKKMERV